MLGKLLLPFVVFTVITGTPLKNPYKCFTYGIDYNGDDNINNGAVDVKDHPRQCQELCAGTVACKAFVWNKDNKNCWLKKMEGDVAIMKNELAVFGPKECEETFIRAGYNFPGGSLDGYIPEAPVELIVRVDFGVGSYEECGIMCNSNPECTHWTWSAPAVPPQNANDNGCFLKKGKISKVKADKFRISGYFNTFT